MEAMAFDAVKKSLTVPPDGVYDGWWGGWMVHWTDLEGNQWEATTSVGIRTPRALVWVIVKEGAIHIKHKIDE